MKFGLAILFLAILSPKVSEPSTLSSSSRGTCKKSKLFSAHNIVAWSTPSRARGFFYKSGLAIDADVNGFIVGQGRLALRDRGGRTGTGERHGFDLGGLVGAEARTGPIGTKD